MVRYRKLTIAELIKILIQYPEDMYVYRGDDTYGELPIGSVFLSIKDHPNIMGANKDIPRLVLEIFEEEGEED